MTLTPEIRAERVAIANDVLAQLRRPIACRPQVVSGAYIIVNRDRDGRYIGDSRDMNYDADARTHLEEIQPYCKCCAMGVMFLSWVRRHNNINVRQLCSVLSFHIEEKMAGVFDAVTLRNIEAAFEGLLLNDGPIFKTIDDFEERADKIVEINAAAKLFYKKFKNPERRMREIMRNIVRNDGEFKFP